MREDQPPMQRVSTIHTRAAVLRDALALMQAEYATELTLDELARRIATSRRQLQRCFQEHGGGGFRDCLTSIRMRRAAELLLETALPVREVAARVGYRQPAQFAKAFARFHGAPPARWRADRRVAAAA